MFLKVKEVIKALFWPILFGIGQIFICGLFMLIYMLQHQEIDFNDSSNYSLLSEYINHHTLLIVILECLIFIPIFYSVYKKYQTNRIPCSFQSICKIFLLSFVLSITLNTLILVIKNYMNFDISNSSITFTTIVSTGIIGPILEEFLFRGIVYGKFTSIFKEKTAFYSSILVFALFHTGGIFQILFAAIIGYFLTFIYQKYHDLRLSMMAHIVVNITSILFSPIILLLF